MALIHCPECGKEISNHAVSCPNCGMPIKTINITINFNGPKCEQANDDLSSEPQAKEEDAKANANPLVCPKCGSRSRQSREKNIRCTNCGYVGTPIQESELAARQKQDAIKAATPKWMTNITLGSWIIGFILLFVSGVSYWLSILLFLLGVMFLFIAQSIGVMDAKRQHKITD